MADATAPEPIVREIHIDAAPETVFEYFTNADKLARWLVTEATLDPRPGGVCRQVHPGEGDDGAGPYHMHGEFLEVTPPHRVVFTWGFTEPEIGVPPGSTTVEVTLAPADGGTLLRLVHRDLPPSSVGDHAAGWTTMLDRLSTAVASMAGERR